MKIMKIYSLILSAAVLATACNSKAPATDTTATPTTVDTGMVTIQPELPVADTQQVETAPAAEPSKKSATTSKKSNNSNTNTTSNSGSGETTADNTSGSGTSTAPADGGTAASTEGAQEEKKGWSKTAKGAVIGGVTGAAAGAVINKKNRGVGAVIGGVTGAAAGAVIGKQMDKKDGRSQ